MGIINTSRNIHLIGIHGCGMKGLALYLVSKGCVVSGSDLKKTGLNDKRISVYQGHQKSHVQGKDLVIYSSAVSQDNVERREAQRLQIPVMSRPEAMAALLEGKQSIGIAGVHGKTTTTGMIGQILINAGMDPTVFVGGSLPQQIQYGRAGMSPWCVFEADESDGSLIDYHPHYAVVTNIELEHVDYFRDLNHVISVFRQFMNQTLDKIIICADDPVCAELMTVMPSSKILSYGLSDRAIIKGEILESTDQGLFFRVMFHNDNVGIFRIPLYGKHQVSNALAAISVCTMLDVPVDIMQQTLAQFCGMERRFQSIGYYRGACVINDYAHHPREVYASLSASKQRFKGKVLAVFQPHRYSRFSRFYHDFAKILSGFDGVVITQIYHGHELNHDDISSVSLYEILKDQMSEPVYYCPALEDIQHLLETMTMDYDAILIMGAGDIETLAKGLVCGDRAMLTHPITSV
ncbi:MAG: UDP-N-acetylmuramate--L-alanine ligase [Chlamydiota bacterium]|nr:UDP-N-acetylmuramate--L-alanine ligase [Chlamydiota bacterium]